MKSYARDEIGKKSISKMKKKNHKSDEHTWYKNQIKPND